MHFLTPFGNLTPNLMHYLTRFRSADFALKSGLNFNTVFNALWKFNPLFNAFWI